MKTTLTKNQKVTRKKTIGKETLIVQIRHDDECGNGHNTFSITGDLYEGRICEKNCVSCGAIHDEIPRFFPELVPYLKWHLCSTDGPLHYLANTLYHAEEHGPTHAWYYLNNPESGIVSKCLFYTTPNDPRVAPLLDTYKSRVEVQVDQKTAKTANLEAARSSAIWPDATLDQLRDKQALIDRLPALMQEFKQAVESLGLVY